MDILLIFVLITVIVGFAIVLFVMTQRIESLKKDQTSGYIKQDMIELTRGVGELRDSLQKTVADRLDRNQHEMRDTLTKQLSESAKLIADVTHRLQN